jgi:hypothetical protein
MTTTMRRLAVFSVLMHLTLTAVGQSQSPVVTRCTAPSGHSYFYPSLLVKGSAAGWQQDGISNGQYLILRDKDGVYDIVFSDAMNRTISSKGDGGQVIVINESGGRLVLLVSYPGMNIETWMFALDEKGIGTATVSQARYGDAAVVKKHSLMSASCRR